MEKGEIAQSEQFHLFPQCFPKVFFFNVLKWVYMEERVYWTVCLSVESSFKPFSTLAALHCGCQPI